MIEWLPLIVSLIGLIGGAIVYRQQKSADRRDQILSERRVVYRDAIAATEDFKLAVLSRDKDRVSASHENFHKSKAALLVNAPEPVIVAMRDMETMVDDMVISIARRDEQPDQSALYKALISQSDAMTTAIRNDLLN